ncbi:MAG: hypothetical protein ACJ0OY_07390 [Dehalococcoidia bacterium]|nr:hypothetical protein [Chloroflexota bacterium]
MGSEKNIAACSMVLGPILMMATFLILLSGVDAQASDILAFTMTLGENSSNVGIGMVIVTIFMGIMFSGFGYVRSTMAGGSGAGLANMGFFLIIGLFVAFLVENSLWAAAADSAATGMAAAAAAGDPAAAGPAGVSTGATLFVASQGIGTIGTITGFLGFILIGLGMIIQKNWNIVVAILLIITGLLGTVGTSIIGYDADAMFLVWISMMITIVVTGVFTYLREE